MAKPATREAGRVTIWSPQQWLCRRIHRGVGLLLSLLALL